MLKRPIVLCTVAFFVAGIVLGAALSPRLGTVVAAPRAELDLGAPAALLIATDGHPARIIVDQDTQTWYYRGASGGLEPRYRVNQGLVVDIRRQR